MNDSQLGGCGHYNKRQGCIEIATQSFSPEEVDYYALPS